MKIAVDMDGVLAQFNYAYVKHGINAEFPDRALPDSFEPTDWWYGNSGFTREEINKALSRIDQVENFWLKLPAYEDNMLALRNFLNNTRDQEVYIVTARKPTAGFNVALQTELWLRYYGVHPEATNNYVGIIPVANPSDKVLLYKSVGMEYSLDDKAETVEECDRLQGHRAFLLDRPWNKHGMVSTRVRDAALFFATIIHDISEDANG